MERKKWSKFVRDIYNRSLCFLPQKCQLQFPVMCFSREKKEEEEEWDDDEDKEDEDAGVDNVLMFDISLHPL